MNYKEINKAILSDRDIDENLVKKDDKFYQYLFNNKVAYYYSKCLSKNQTEKEKWIIKRGEELNERYYKTLKLLKDICDKNNIDFLLYKTHKYIPEVVDGDIDLFVKEKDFQKFLDVFHGEGFKTEEDEPGKGKCEKDGYCITEPHINISWNENITLKENDVWNFTEIIKIKEINIEKTTKEMDIFSFFTDVFYGPNYVCLYKLLVFKQINQKKLFEISADKNIQGDLDKIVKQLQFDKTLNTKLPVFLDNFNYLKWWFKRIMQNKKLSQPFKFKILIYFFYWKYRYLLIDKLPFSHNWENK
ncbi:MAG: hypothetical protein KAQ87_03095 [Candidatus Pacebacteria bacterium]|nr:hypothetical protein [Candidatus Paceibacterota bacterium]